MNLRLLLAGLHRYLAIKYYEWYKKRMNNKMADIAMIVTWILNAVIIDSPYLTPYKSLDKRTANTTHMHWLFAWNVFRGVTPDDTGVLGEPYGREFPALTFS